MYRLLGFMYIGLKVIYGQYMRTVGPI